MADHSKRGRKSQWHSTGGTTSIRVPKSLSNQIQNYAKQLDKINNELGNKLPFIAGEWGCEAHNLCIDEGKYFSTTQEKYLFKTFTIQQENENVIVHGEGNDIELESNITTSASFFGKGHIFSDYTLTLEYVFEGKRENNAGFFRTFGVMFLNFHKNVAEANGFFLANSSHNSTILGQVKIWRKNDRQNSL